METTRQPSGRPTVGLTVAFLAGSSVALAACSAGAESSAQPSAEAPHGEVHFDFERQAADFGTIVAKVTNAGIATVATAITTANGGRATLDAGVEGGYGLRFPAFSTSAPAAAVLVRSVAGHDVLGPGARDFRFGADFALDRLSAGGPLDNGNNLVQRGLAEDADQYKIQVDHGVTSCRVASADGVAFVKSSERVVPERWYRAVCLRLEDRLVLTVTAWVGTDWGEPQVSTTLARTGNLRFEDPGVPLAIGAKVDANGFLVSSATDQFNGVIDNVHVEVVG